MFFHMAFRTVLNLCSLEPVLASDRCWNRVIFIQPNCFVPVIQNYLELSGSGHSKKTHINTSFTVKLVFFFSFPPFFPNIIWWPTKHTGPCGRRGTEVSVTTWNCPSSPRPCPRRCPRKPLAAYAPPPYPRPDELPDMDQMISLKKTMLGRWSPLLNYILKMLFVLGFQLGLLFFVGA